MNKPKKIILLIKIHALEIIFSAQILSNIFFKFSVNQICSKTAKCSKGRRTGNYWERGTGRPAEEIPFLALSTFLPVIGFLGLKVDMGNGVTLPGVDWNNQLPPYGEERNDGDMWRVRGKADQCNQVRRWGWRAEDSFCGQEMSEWKGERCFVCSFHSVVWLLSRYFPRELLVTRDITFQSRKLSLGW